MSGDTKSVSDWENGGITFRAFRDKNSDGFIDKEELMVKLETFILWAVAEKMNITSLSIAL